MQVGRIPRESSGNLNGIKLKFYWNYSFPVEKVLFYSSEIPLEYSGALFSVGHEMEAANNVVVV